MRYHYLILSLFILINSLLGVTVVMADIYSPQILPLVTIENDTRDLLRNKTKTVTWPLSQDIQQFIQSLKFTMENLESPFGKPAGLAATQVGESWKIIAMQIPEEAKEKRKDVHDFLPLTVWINPSYKPVGDKKYLDWEGCYSVPDKMGEVARYEVITYEATTEQGEKISGTATDFFARLIQHEIGHLNGQVYIDLITEPSRFGDVQEMMQVRALENNSND